MSKQSLLRDIQAAHFSLTETRLFLDTHPCDREAMEYYLCQKEKLAELMMQWENVCPDIRKENGAVRWAWADTPWPWQVEG